MPARCDRSPTVSLPVRPGEAHLVAQALGDGALPQDVAFTQGELDDARASDRRPATGVVFVVGRPNIAESAEVIELADSTPRRRSSRRRRSCRRFVAANVMGALDMGLAPRASSRSRLRRRRAAVATPWPSSRRFAPVSRARSLMLGGCLLGNVLDVVGAREALDTADVVVVTGHGGASLAYADVVLPAAVQHERLGTVTNIEGRVTAVAPKIVAPGSAWPDVAIASELAEELGQSLGLASVEQAAKTIEETTGYPALSVLNDSTSDGVVVGDVAERSARRPLDPMAFPGIRSTEAVGLGANAGTTSFWPTSPRRPRRRRRRSTTSAAATSSRCRSPTRTRCGSISADDSSTTASPCRVRRHWPR